MCRYCVREVFIYKVFKFGNIVGLNGGIEFGIKFLVSFESFLGVVKCIFLILKWDLMVLEFSFLVVLGRINIVYWWLELVFLGFN